MTIGLDAFEDFLGVVQYRGGGVEAQRAIGADFMAVPAAIGGPADVCHVVAEVTAEAGIGQDGVANGSIRRLRGRADVEAFGHVGVSVAARPPARNAGGRIIFIGPLGSAVPSGVPTRVSQR